MPFSTMDSLLTTDFTIEIWFVVSLSIARRLRMISECIVIVSLSCNLLWPNISFSETLSMLVIFVDMSHSFLTYEHSNN